MKSSKLSSNTCSLHSPHHHTYSALPSSAPPISRHGLSEIMADEDVNNAKCIIKRWEKNGDKFGRFSSLFLTDRVEAKKFLEATVGLQHAMNYYYVKLSATSDKLVGAQQLMQIVMKRLKFEFYTILSANRNNLDSGSVSARSGVSISTTAPPSPPSPASEAERAVDDLKSVAECMITCGYGKECVSIYRSVRKSIIEESLYYLGIERLTDSQLKKMEWTILEAKIKRWLHAVRIALATLFYREKIICDVVFSSSEKIAEACFVGISREAAADLFAFAENVCKCKKVLSPEKIFRLLDLYEAISDLWPDIRFIFSEKLSAAAAAQMKVGETVSAMLGQFEKAIRKDSSPPPRGGSIHPLTRYVMNFLVYLGDYGAAVSNIVEDWPVKVRLCIPDSGGEADASEISRRLAWLIMVVLCKLNSKAAEYNDVALSYLFLANNLNYVVSKAQNSNLGFLIGQDWIRNHELRVKSYLDKYERIGWSNVIAAVPADPAVVTPPSKVSECLEKFYVSLQEACRKQGSWVIADPKIREDVKISLGKRIVSGYRVLCEQSKMAGSVMKYAPEDLQNYLLALFSADP